jgi:hypothetical protein
VSQRYKAVPRGLDISSDVDISILVAIDVVHTCTQAYMHTGIHAHRHTCTQAYMHTGIHCMLHTRIPHTAYMHTACLLWIQRQDSHSSTKLRRDFPSAGSTSPFRHSATAVQLPSFCCVSIRTAYLRDCRLLATTAPFATVAAPRMAGQSITRRGVVVWDKGGRRQYYYR